MSVLATWSDAVAQDTTHIIAPDGCRDLILQRVPGRAPEWFVTALDARVSVSAASAGTRYLGWRMHPGARLDDRALLGALGGTEDPARAEELLRDHTAVEPALDEALQALAEAPSVAAAARGAGLSVRALQRVVGTTGQPPLWWMRLARVRRAARGVFGVPLADLAAEHGFADQAHMTRDFAAFLGATPGALRGGAGPAILSGYGV